MKKKPNRPPEIQSRIDEVKKKAKAGKKSRPNAKTKKEKPNKFKNFFMRVIQSWNTIKNPSSVTETPTLSAYYFSATGSDTTGDGTEANPFQTIAKANTLTLSPGTALYFEAGSTFNGKLIIRQSGNGDAYNKVRSYGTGRATLYGGTSSGLGVDFGVNYVDIDGVNVLGDGRTLTDGPGISLWGNNFIQVRNSEIRGFKKAGLEGWEASDVICEYVRTIDNGQAGIELGGPEQDYNTGVMYTQGSRPTKNITVRYCHAENNAGNPDNLDNHSGNGIVLYAIDNSLIEHCTATNNGWDMPRTGNGPVGIWGAECDSMIIRNCISWNNKTSSGGQDGGGFDFDGGCSNCLMEYCLSYGNQGPGLGLFQYAGATPWRNNIVRYCAFIEDGSVQDYGPCYQWNGDASASDMQSGLIHNCLFFTSKIRYGIKTEAKSGNFKWLNNIVYAGGDVLTGGIGSGTIFRGNGYWTPGGVLDFFNTYSNVNDWGAATGQETDANGVIVGTQVDPLFEGPLGAPTLTDTENLQLLTAYRLKPESELRDRGVILSDYTVTQPTTDFFKNPSVYNVKPEPGIHELQTDAPTDTTDPTPTGETTFVNFGAAGSYVTIEDSSTWNSEPNPISLIARFRFTQTTPAVIYEHGDNTTNLFLHVVDGGRLNCGTYSTHAYTSTKAYNDGDFHVLEQQYDNATDVLRVYIDRVLVFELNPGRDPLGSGKEWTIGSRYGASLQFEGDIDIIQLRSDHRTQEAITAGIVRGPQAGLLVELDFGSSPIADTSGNGWLIKTYGTVVLGVETEGGSDTQTETPMYADLNGVDAYAELPPDNEDYSAGITVHLRIRRPAGSLENTALFWMGNNTVQDYSLLIFHPSSGFLDVRFYNNTNGTFYNQMSSPYNAIINDKWQWFTYRMDNANGVGTIFRDAVSIATKTFGGTFPNRARNNAYIGMDGTDALSPKYSVFDIDEIQVWNTARTDAEIATDVQSYSSPQPGLVRHWKLNGNVEDKSGGDHNGIVKGALTFVAH